MSAGEGPAPEEFLSGRVGHVGPRRAPALRAADSLLDALQVLRALPRALDAAARELAPQRVLALSIYRPGSEHIEAAVGELRATRHELRLACGSTGDALPALADRTALTGLEGGKFQNLNTLLEVAGRHDEDWLLVVDDDVSLPPGFLDRLLAVAAGLGLDLCQPALTLASNAAWPVTRRRVLPVARETRFIEIGPVTLFGRRAAAELLPFPDLRFGWGLDLHWAAVAAQHGWKLGIVDAVAVRHAGSVASAYPADAAVAEARRFLAARDFLPASRAGEVVAAHRSLR